MNEIGTVPASVSASTGWPGMEGSRKENIMAHFNVESLKSYAIAGVASLYCSLMLLAAVGPNAAHFRGPVACPAASPKKRRPEGRDRKVSNEPGFSQESPQSADLQIGRAHVCTPVTQA